VSFPFPITTFLPARYISLILYFFPVQVS
jgi:hypothetical protein